MSQLYDCEGKPIDLAEGDALVLATEHERGSIYWLMEDGRRKIYASIERRQDERATDLNVM